MPNSCDRRYKVTGYFNADGSTIFFDMEEVARRYLPFRESAIT
ncbi:MAG: hypothetical protein PHT78_07115 [Desulfitobacteriaceae bacterium]|nr:hypothetical protein [Desulfitobacteriaceae bacterium]